MFPMQGPASSGEGVGSAVGICQKREDGGTGSATYRFDKHTLLYLSEQCELPNTA
jgi:hypothetical protein